MLINNYFENVYKYTVAFFGKISYAIVQVIYKGGVAMFGYIKTEESELKVKEYEFYRGTYCGLCRAMGKCTGQCSRITLNYDFVFLALVRLLLLSEDIKFTEKRCLAHPFERRISMVGNTTLTYCAGASAILNYQKIVDDIADERGIKRLRARFALPFAALSRKKVLRKSPELCALDAAVAKHLQRLSELEHAGTPSVDIPAAEFGGLLGDIMSFGLEGTGARVAYELGKNIGAWIYIADAIDDIPEDIEKKRYNPIVTLYGGKAPTDQELRSLSYAVRNHLYGAEAAFDLFDSNDTTIKNIICNILYIGIPQKTDSIIERRTKEKAGKEAAND